MNKGTYSGRKIELILSHIEFIAVDKTARNEGVSFNTMIRRLIHDGFVKRGCNNIYDITGNQGQIDRRSDKPWDEFE